MTSEPISDPDPLITGKPIPRGFEWTGATLSVDKNEWGDDWSIITDRVYGFVSRKMSGGYKIVFTIKHDTDGSPELETMTYTRNVTYIRDRLAADSPVLPPTWSAAAAPAAAAQEQIELLIAIAIVTFGAL